MAATGSPPLDDVLVPPLPHAAATAVAAAVALARQVLAGQLIVTPPFAAQRREGWRLA